MAKYGYGGTHLTIGARGFIAAYVAPLLTAQQWTAILVAQLPKASPPRRPTTSSPAESQATVP